MTTDSRGKKCNSIMWAILLASTFLLGSCNCFAESDDADVHSRRHALLIGVSQYPTLDDRYQLQGPANDVRLMTRVLKETFDFTDENVVSLSETDGENDPKLMPTFANIEREFSTLVTRVRPHDEVVVFLAGHGSQQPASTQSTNRETDGLDEIFLPRDVGKWNGDPGHVEGTISDNQIAEWVDAISQRDTSVWLIVDACHSGTLLRSSVETVRQVPADRPDGLGIPSAILTQPRPDAAQQQNDVRMHDDSFSQIQSRSVAAIYACLPDEVTVERAMPVGTTSAPHHGLFTYTLCRVLTQASQSGRLLTYNELVQSIRREYAVMGRRFPTPFAEGPNLDREIFGDRTSAKVPGFLLTNGVTVNAGALSGLTEGSILSVVSPSENDNLVGFVEVIEVDAMTSQVEPCDYAGVLAPETLPEDARLRPVYLGLGDPRINVAIDQVGIDVLPVSLAVQRELTEWLESINEDKLPFGIVAKIDQADWLIRPGRDGIYLVRSSESVTETAEADAIHFGPIAHDDRLIEKLTESLQRIARAENLRRIAAGSERFGSPGQDKLNLDIELDRRPNGNSASLQVPVDWRKGNVQFFDGDRIAIKIRNPNRFDVDVNLFYIDSEFAVTPLFPVDGEFNRLARGDETSIRCTLTASTVGSEHLIVIAVRGTDERVDLSGLAQPGAVQVGNGTKTRGAPIARSDSTLTDLLRSALQPDASFRTRGIRRDDADDHAIELITWRIHDESRPATE